MNGRAHSYLSHTNSPQEWTSVQVAAPSSAETAAIPQRFRPAPGPSWVRTPTKQRTAHGWGRAQKGIGAWHRTPT